ncbi:hypothetical protein NDU88_010992 [Pleurodeles waltl]|uniref:Uncharacterized protein n=1 Tax=Pleurodeles waltl TaxID=8319 RepID=A0AAV7Q3I0_PLEWA|nr:hypothetical protein NDU88_010992 [Pleurodeles waltl]
MADPTPQRCVCDSSLLRLQEAETAEPPHRPRYGRREKKGKKTPGGSMLMGEPLGVLILENNWGCCRATSRVSRGRLRYDPSGSSSWKQILLARHILCLVARETDRVCLIDNKGDIERKLVRVVTGLRGHGSKEREDHWREGRERR